MSEMIVPKAVSGEAEAASRLRDLMLTGVVVAGALLVLYLVLMAQGIYLHEFNHDGRHMFAANCH